MACFAVLLLAGFVSISAAKEALEVYAAVGQSLTLPLDFQGLTNKHGLSWTHNSKSVFVRERSRVSVGKPGDIAVTGALQLKNLQFSSAGTYEAKVFHPNSTLAKAQQGSLVVMDKVSKPQLTYVCDCKSGAVHLICNVAKPQGLDFSWMLDDIMLTDEKQHTLSSAQLTGPRNYTCGVANKVSMERSSTVRSNCPTLLCFPHKIVYAAITGGVSVILLLIAIIIVLICYYKCEKTRTERKVDVRMLSLHKREPAPPISPDYETMHPTEDPRPPSPKPSPRAFYPQVSLPETQTGNSSLQLSTATGGQPPSPVPKPRTKISNT